MVIDRVNECFRGRRRNVIWVAVVTLIGKKERDKEKREEEEEEKKNEKENKSTLLMNNRPS